MKVRMVNRGTYQSFVDVDAGNAKILSVSRITAALPKDALINWAATATAEYAVNNWEALAAKPIGARLNEIAKGRYADADKAKQSGTDVHKFGERLLRGESVKIPPELAEFVDSYVRFMEEFDFHPVYIEQAVYSQQHVYAGRLDIEGDILLPDLPEYEDIPRDDQGYTRALIDAKKTKSGIFGETALQLTGYRHANMMILDDGQHVPRDSVDATFGLHIRRDGYDLIRVDSSEETFRKFLYLKQVAHLAVENDGADLKSLVLGRVPPPAMPEFRMVRIKPDEGAPF